MPQTATASLQNPTKPQGPNKMLSCPLYPHPSPLTSQLCPMVLTPLAALGILHSCMMGFMYVSPSEPDLKLLPHGGCQVNTD